MRMKDANQLKAKIKNLARLKGVDARALLRLYMMERFLDRVAHSDYRNSFVLKGGMLISYLVGVDLRTTMDIDTTMQNIPLSEKDVEKFISKVIAVDVNDGVLLELQSLETIMEEADYPGIRASLIADFDGTKTPVKIDISTGHVITPRPIETKLPLMFADAITLPVYPVATILAEKLQTILSREEFNTRMRDFYDLHALRVAQGDSTFKKEEIAAAFYATSHKRDTLYLLDKAETLYAKFERSETLHKQWESYRKKALWSENLDWKEIMQDLKFFLTLVLK